MHASYHINSCCFSCSKNLFLENLENFGCDFMELVGTHNENRTAKEYKNPFP
jgi:hypothetical protein